MAIKLPGRKAEAAEAAATAGFELECVCGTVHTGQRRRRHQQIICNKCATPLFVLPMDVYPAPAVRSKEKGKARGGAAAGVIGGGVGVVRSGVGAGVRGVTGTAQDVSRGLGAVVRWFATPLKIAILGAVIVLCVTGYLIHRRSAIAEAEQVARTATAAGFEFLREGDFERAAAELRMAVAAVDYSGMIVPHERRLRQAAREATALADRASGSLVDLIESVAEAGVDEDGHWKRAQQFGYVDSWIVMDAAVTRTEANGFTRTRIALPIRVGEEGKPVRVVADLDVFEDVPLSESPTLVTVAAQVRSVREFNKGWEIELNPETAFLWETPSLYTELGFAFDPLSNSRQTVEERLQQQREWQGASPAEPAVDADTDEEVDADVEGDLAAVGGEEDTGTESGVADAMDETDEREALQ